MWINKWIHRKLGALRLLLIDYDCKYNIDFISVGVLLTHKIPITFHKGWGLIVSLEHIVQFEANLTQLFRHLL